ncbi:MAG TPA: ATP synthase F0 subunit B [Thermoanaerobaculia bacterium]|nr:ATP synthase F0 subunit B [Thermoanaerobaculia bacterium]
MQIDLVPDPSLLAIVVIFFLNYLVVRRYFLKPIDDILVERETEQKTAERLYEESLARFQEAATEMEERLHAAKREAGEVRERYRAEAGAHRAAMVEKTQAEAKKIVTEAGTSLGRDVDEAREKITRDSEGLARLAAERILGRAV